MPFFICETFSRTFRYRGVPEQRNGDLWAKLALTLSLINHFQNLKKDKSSFPAIVIIALRVRDFCKPGQPGDGSGSRRATDESKRSSTGDLKYRFEPKVTNREAKMLPRPTESPRMKNKNEPQNARNRREKGEATGLPFQFRGPPHEHSLSDSSCN